MTACLFCNTADNQYFAHAAKRGLRFDGLTPDQLVAQRLPYVEKTRATYHQFWEQNIRPATGDTAEDGTLTLDD